MNAWELCDLLAIGHVRLWNGNMCIRKWPSKFPANLKLTWSEKVTAVYRLALVTLMKHPRTSHLTLVQPIYMFPRFWTVLRCWGRGRKLRVSKHNTRHCCFFFVKGKWRMWRIASWPRCLNLKGFQIALWLLLVVEEVMHHMQSIPFSHRLSEWL